VTHRRKRAGIVKLDWELKLICCPKAVG